LLSHRFARLSGVALTLLCVLYFLQSLLAIDLQQVLALPVDGLALGLALSILIYTGLLIGVATAFAHLVQATGHRRATAAEGLMVWGQANLAKYLPGNILHFAGRQVLGARHGWPQAKIATASLLEIGLLVLLSALVAGAALMLTGERGLVDFSGLLGVAVVLAALGLVAMLCGAGLARRLPGPLAKVMARIELAHPRAVLPALVYLTLFFLGMSLISWWLYGLVTGVVAVADLPVLTTVFLASWLLGFVVPGAPGGIGVREGTFALLGGVLLGEASLVIVALLMRLVTLAGEGMLFLVALAMARDWPVTSGARDRLVEWRSRLLGVAAVSSRQTGRLRSR
jgi:hypothetical protein